MRQYLDMLQHILDNGEDSDDRTGVGTRSIFGYQIRFNLQDGFPLVTTKRVPFRLPAHEILWMVAGDTNTKYLRDNNVTIWDEWADENGNLGPTYGSQWRNFGGVDQLAKAQEDIRKNPNSRRILVSAWNPAELSKMRLPPCHMFYQFYVRRSRLSCHMYIRSWDTFLGGPFNIAGYALLTHMMAHATELEPWELIISSGDTHIYRNHFEQVRLQLTREPLALPRLEITRPADSIFDIKYEDLKLIDYKSHRGIKAEVAV